MPRSREMRTSLLAVPILIAVVAMAPAAQASHSELLARWHLNTAAGGFTPDDSGHGLQGEVNGGATLVPGGRFGNALDLAAMGDSQIDVLDTATLEPPQVTVLAWVKLGSEPIGTHYILAKGASACAGASYALRTSGAGLPSGRGLTFQVRGGSTTYDSPNAGTGIWNGQWHAVAGTFDGATIRLYVDGAQVGGGTPAATGIAYNLTSDDLRIGNYPLSNSCGGGLVFQGLIDEARVYNRALAPFEIAHLHTAAASSPPNLPAPAVNTAPPSVTNAGIEPHPGDVLGRNPGAWDGSPTGYLEQWRRCDAAGANCTDIQGATESTYTLGAADVGRTIRVRIRAVNPGGTSAPTESGPTAVVRAGPPPPLVARLSVQPNPSCTGVQTYFDASQSTGPIVSYRFEYSELNGVYEGSTRTVFVSEGASAVSPPVSFNWNRVGGVWYDDPETGVSRLLSWHGFRDPAMAKVILTSPTGASASATVRVEFAQKDQSEQRKQCPRGLPEPWTYPLGEVAKTSVRFTGTTVAVRLPCESVLACAGGLSVTYSGSVTAAARRPRVVIASKAFRISPGRKRTVRAKLNARGRKLLRARKKLRVKLTVTALSPRGKNVSRSRMLALRSRKR